MLVPEATRAPGRGGPGAAPAEPPGSGACQVFFFRMLFKWCQRAAGSCPKGKWALRSAAAHSWCELLLPACEFSVCWVYSFPCHSTQCAGDRRLVTSAERQWRAPAGRQLAHQAGASTLAGRAI